MSFLRRGFLLMPMAFALVIQLPAQVGSIPSFDSRQSAGPLVPRAEESSADPGPGGGGAPPAGELISSGGMVFVIPGVINLEGLSGTGVLFGGGFSQGYGWVSNGTTIDPKGYISVVQPYVGLFQAGHRHKVLFEYSPTVDLYNGQQWDGGVLQRGGIRGYDMLSQRWAWTFSAYSTYGQEYLRELSGLAIGQYPGWLTFSGPTDTLLLASTSTGLSWRRKPRQEFSFTVGDTYSSITHGPHNNAASARAQMTNDFGSNSTWYSYAQANRYTNQPGCTRAGVGGGFVWNASPSTQLALEAGPEFGSGRCVDQVTASFGGSLTQHFSPRTAVYLSAARDLVEPYLLQSRWADIFSAKVGQKTSQNTSVNLGSAYVRSSDLPAETVSRYRGFLLFSEFHWRMSDSLTLIGSYRYFKRDIAEPRFAEPGFVDRHSWVFFSIVWHPMARGMLRSL